MKANTLPSYGVSRDRAVGFAAKLRAEGRLVDAIKLFFDYRLRLRDKAFG
jgi:hypothetical protein